MTDTRPTDTVFSASSLSEPLRAPIGLLTPGTALGERYEICAVLGHGGFAVVYLAHDRELGREVALKVLREDRLSPGSLSRLKREVRVARDLAHPNVVRVFDIETAGSAVFVSLEAVPGGSLRDRMGRGPMPVEEALRLAAGIFAGLAALHGVGIVHRDVKPGNVLVAADGTVKLADFGLALHLEGDDTRVTATETAVGTLEYLAPEQAMGEPVDARSDLYAAGVVLFEMLTGRLPHAGRSSLGNLIARFREQPPDVADLRPDVPRWLARLIGRLLATESAERYPSAAAVLHDLERRRVARRPSRKRRWALAVAALVAVLAAAAAWLAAEARGREFSHVVLEGSDTVAGIDRRGRPLWRFEHTDLAHNFVPFRAEEGGPRLLAATLGAAQDKSLDRTLRIHFLDPDTGSVEDAMVLPDLSGTFPGFSRTYGAKIDALDLDGDGGDELVVTYVHTPYWPSFSILVEPDARRASALLIASGHHHYQAAADLDGDGRRELIFAGVNNRMGWRVGIAAVQPFSPAAGPEPHRRLPGPALSADRVARANLGAALWYAVGPRRILRDGLPPVAIDPAARRMELVFTDGSRAALDFQGFVPGSGAGRAPRVRQDERNRAHQAAAEAARLLDSDRAADALPFLEAALRAARAADDLHLEGWLVQLQVEALALARRDDDAEHAVAQAIALEPEAASEAWFTAARSWHRAGALDLALAAYDRCESQPGFSSARAPYETLEGKLFALVELGRFEAARKAIALYERGFGVADPALRAYTEFVIWRSGGRPDPGRIPAGLDAMDLHWYWNLEARAARGEEPARLLEEIDRARAASTDTGPLLDSLAADLLARAGRTAEARALAATALARLDAGIGQSLVYRVHRPMLTERLARLERAGTRDAAP